MVLKILLEILFFLLVIAVAYIVVVFIVCKDITGTWNGFRFLFDYKYWSFAILNHEYNISLDRDEDYRKFVVYFSIIKAIAIPLIIKRIAILFSFSADAGGCLLRDPWPAAAS